MHFIEAVVEFSLMRTFVCTTLFLPSINFFICKKNTEKMQMKDLKGKERVAFINYAYKMPLDHQKKV
jgi:hypothetical protein